MVRISPRRLALACVAGILATLAACADQPTAPTAPSAAATALPSASRDKSDQSSANATLEWQATARSLIVSHAISPTTAARILALVGVGQYGAVVAADGRDEGREDAREEGEGGGRASHEAQRGAVAGSSATVLTYLFPDAAAALESQLAADGAAGSGKTHPHFTRGVAAGRAMGDRMIAFARNDGFSVAWDGQPAVDLYGGGWKGLAGVAGAGFQIPKMTPYYLVKTSASPSRQSQFRPLPPPAVGSPEFLAGIAVTRAAALARSDADIIFANFWNLNSGTVTALGYWDNLASGYIADEGLDERSAAHIFAVMNSAAMDAVIGCWEAKYYYMFLRPSMADATISRSPGVPGFPYGLPNHPSYPSGHSCVSAAAVQVLAHYFPEHSQALNAQVAEAGRSRVVGGIHYPFDVAAGQKLGRATADWAMAYDRQRGGLLRAIPWR